MDRWLTLIQSRRASLQNQGPRLKKLALPGEPTSQFVAENIGLFFNDARKITQLTKLPADEKQLVLDELARITCGNAKGDMATLKQKREAVGVLLSSETRSFDLNWLLTLCPEKEIYTCIDQTLKLIASRAPNISNFSLTYGSKIFMFVDGSTNKFGPFGDGMLNSISRMTNLKVLHLTKYTLTFSRMLALCRSLKHLEQLDVIIAIKNFDAEVKLKDFELLSNLKAFLFKIYVKDDDYGIESRKYRQELVELCLLNLPMLEVVGDQNPCLL